MAKEPAKLPLAHRWILSRINATIKDVRAALDGYNFNEVASASYQFVWHEFCDWYLEWIKADLFSDDTLARDQAKAVLLIVLEQVLKLMHPITPFVTEEIWSQLPGERKTIMLESFPEVNPAWEDAEAEGAMNLLMGVISGLRTIRTEAEVHPERQDRGHAHLSGCGKTATAHRLCRRCPGHGAGELVLHHRRRHGAR